MVSSIFRFGARRRNSSPDPPKHTVGPESRRKLVFLHIPKTAGTSFRRILEHNYPGPKLVSLYCHFPFDDELTQRLRARARVAEAFVGHIPFGVDQALGVSADYVTFLRHPIERAISYYRHNERHSDSPHYHQLKQGISLVALLRAGQMPEMNNNMTRMLVGSRDNSILDDDAVLDRALRNLKERFVFVGVTERFDESLKVLADRLDWPAGGQIPQLNQAPQCASAPVSEETLECISHYNRLDAQLYSYACERLARDIDSIS